ncbi:TRAF3-interacting protein 1-like [Anopheles cruzii]|uniref:TRAF3-interacting protein 1-like n=1 Tax=Anopheles cruzii TaxID=68878 RepID=UPI0022EC392F|nr:TRAF3-interacting protein 1-like [Anopheles cruzii]
MDDFDIYGDLDKCDAEAEKQSREVQSLLGRIAELEQQVQKKEQQKCEVLNKNSVLLENISSLLLTAKAELKRKDTIIADLRKQCDNAIFRRGSHSTREHSSNRASNTHNRGTQTVSVHSQNAGVQVELAMEDDYQERKRKCVRGHEEVENRRDRERNREQDRRCEKYRERDREKDRGRDRDRIRDTERERDRENARDRHSDKYRVRDSEKERDRENTVVIPIKDPPEIGVIDEENKSRPQFKTDDENVSTVNPKESSEPRSNGENIGDVMKGCAVDDGTVKPASGTVCNELHTESESVAPSIGNSAVEDQSSVMQIPEPTIESSNIAPVESESLVGPSSNSNPTLTPLQSYFMSFSKEYESYDTDEVPNSTSLVPSASVIEENKKEELFKATRTDLSLTDSVPYYIAKNSNAVFTNLKSGLSQKEPQNQSTVTNSSRSKDESRSTKSIDTLEAIKSLSPSSNSSTDAPKNNRKRRISLDASSALGKRPKTDNNSADSQLSTTTLSSTYFSSISLPIVSALDYDQASATKRRSSTNLNSPIRPTPMVVLHSPAKSLGTPLKHTPMSESDFDANSSIQLIMDSLLQTPIKSEAIDGEADQGSSIMDTSFPQTVDKLCFDESLNLSGFENESANAVKLEPCEENTSPSPSDAGHQNEKGDSLKCDKQQKRELKIVRKKKVLNTGDAHCRTLAPSSPSGEKNELSDHNYMNDAKTTDGKSNGVAADQPNRKRVPPAEGKTADVCDQPAQDQSPAHVGRTSSCKENETVDQPDEQQNQWVKKESILRTHGQYHTPEGPVNFVREMRVVKESPTYMRVYITRRKV